MRNIHAALLPIALFVTVPANAAPEQVFAYSPAVVALSGRIKREIFAGRPDYDRFTHGDEREVYWILHLTRSVSVAASTVDDVDIGEKHLSRLQLVFVSAHPEEQYSSYRHFLGEPVTITGTLYHGINVHHKTDVLLQVQKIEAFTK